MKRNFLTYGIIFLSLCCFLDLSVGWSCFIFIALAVLLFSQQRGEGTPLPPVSLLLLANVLGYPIVVVMPWMYQELWARMNPYIIEIAMLWATRGFAAFCCAYLLGDAFTRRFHQQTHLGWNEGERLAYMRYAVHVFGIVASIAWVVRQYYFGLGLTFIASRTIYDINSTGSSVSQVLNLLISLRDPFLFFFGVMYVRRLHDRFMWLLFAGIAIGLIVEIIVMGSKGTIIRLLVIAALIITFTTRRMSLKQFCAGALMVVAVYMSFAIITEYRSILADGNRRGEDVFNFSIQAETFANAFLASLPFSEKSEQRRTTVDEEAVFNRIASGIFSFGKLLYYTGERSPHEHAWQVFRIPLYSVAPRAWLEKPVFFNSGRFGREYFHFSFTGISVSTVGSFYYAWGYGGILAGMTILGSTLSFFTRRVLLQNTAFNSATFMVAMMMTLVNVGASLWDVGIAFCRLAVILLGLYMFYPVFRWLKPRHRPVTAYEPLR